MVGLRRKRRRVTEHWMQSGDRRARKQLTDKTKKHWLGGYLERAPCLHREIEEEHGSTAYADYEPQTIASKDGGNRKRLQAQELSQLELLYGLGSIIHLQTHATTPHPAGPRTHPGFVTTTCYPMSRLDVQ